MTRADLLHAVSQVPFRPFRLHLADGSQPIDITDRRHFSLTRRRFFVYLKEEKEGKKIHVLSCSDIVIVQYLE